MKRRYNGLDLMKVVAAFFVVCAHVINNALNRLFAMRDAGELVKDFSYYFFISLRVFCTWAVPMFIMASGAFVLASSGTKDYRTFYRKSLDRIVKPTVVFSIIYSIVIPGVYYLAGAFGEAGLVGAVQMSLTRLAKGAPADHMWYMFTLIILYLMAPFVVAMREMLGDRHFAIAAVALTVMGTISNLARPPVLNWDPGYATNMLGIFMLGYVIRQRIGATVSWKKAALFLMVGVAAGILQLVAYETAISASVVHAVLADWLPYNPLNIVMAASFLAAAMLMPVRRDFSKPAAMTYWIYLSHPLFMLAVNLVGAGVTGRGFLEIGVALPEFLLCVAIVFSLSCALAWVIERVLAAKRKANRKRGGTET